MWSAAYPAAALYANNSRYDSFQAIPDNEKRKFWIVMIGESEGRDFSGNRKPVPHYLKIPKGEAQQAFSSVIERILNKSREKYPDTTQEFLGKLAKDVSPVTEASILPPGLQQAFELQANYSLFREKQIEPEYLKIGRDWMKTEEVPTEFRATQSTSEIAKAIGQAMGWSPIKIDYVIKNGLLNDIIRGIDLPLKGFSKESDFAKTTELPFIRSILGSSNYGLDLKAQKAEADKLKEANRKKIERRLQNQKEKQ
jgi:hypothetical protein